MNYTKNRVESEVRTWALLSWLFYLLYIHIRIDKNTNPSFSLWILALSFIILLICWFGINYIPAAKDSIHIYSK
ncbi:MAG: cytochrome c biogenesis protein CcsA [Bacteroidales bacterium]|nr:cytochrome c biogenesis protein CcsA [Bacteroidales bacterium]